MGEIALFAVEGFHQKAGPHSGYSFFLCIKPFRGATQIGNYFFYDSCLAGGGGACEEDVFLLHVEIIAECQIGVK